MASWKGHVEVVRELLLNNINVNQVDNYGYNALFETSGEGHVDVVRELLKTDIDVNIEIID